MNDKEFARLMRGTEVIGTDWPLSLGYTVHVMTDRPAALCAVRKSEQDMDFFAIKTCGEGLETARGLSCALDKRRQYVIMIRATEDGVAVAAGRLIEIIVHECSHIVDYICQRTHAVPCTETRAYLIDWLVGRVCASVMPELWTVPALGHTSSAPAAPASAG